MSASGLVFGQGCVGRNNARVARRRVTSCDSGAESDRKYVRVTNSRGGGSDSASRRIRYRGTYHGIMFVYAGNGAKCLMSELVDLV